MTKETKRASYYANNSLNQLRYLKSYQSESMGYYKVGIKSGVYKAIIIESEQNQWKPGEVKATFESSSMKGSIRLSGLWEIKQRKSFCHFGE